MKKGKKAVMGGKKKAFTPRQKLVLQERVGRQLLGLREKLWDMPGGAVVNIAGYKVKITDGPNAYMQYKDEFVRGVYRFATEKRAPVIIDGGSNMGVSILAFKHHYPEARITGFEPDPAIYELLKGNLGRNKIDGVKLVNAGLSGRKGSLWFSADGSAGGRVLEKPDTGSVKVPVVCLSDYLKQSVDLVKLNIEGQELGVLKEVAASGRFRKIDQLVLEYHGWAGGKQNLGDILNLLDQQGYRYLVHDFDAETCSITKPPFRYRPQADWFCVVYAQRV